MQQCNSMVTLVACLWLMACAWGTWHVACGTWLLLVVCCLHNLPQFAHLADESKSMDSESFLMKHRDTPFAQWAPKTVSVYLCTNPVLYTVLQNAPRWFYNMGGTGLAGLSKEERRTVFKCIPAVEGEPPRFIAEGIFLQMVSKAIEASAFVSVEHWLSPRISWPCSVLCLCLSLSLCLCLSLSLSLCPSLELSLCPSLELSLLNSLSLS